MRKRLLARDTLQNVQHALGERELCTRHVGEVDHHEEILNVAVEDLLELARADLGDGKHGIHEVPADDLVLDLATALCVQPVRKWHKRGARRGRTYHNVIHIGDEVLERLLELCHGRLKGIEVGLDREGVILGLAGAQQEID